MRREIFRCVFGSRLFGTETPDSDEDYRSVVLPSREEILLGRPEWSREVESRDRANVAGDVDLTETSVQAFLRLLGKGEVTSIETLFAPPIVEGPEWGIIRDNRHRLVSRNVSRFVGFSKSQISRFGTRGQDVAAIMEVLRIIPEGRETVSARPDVTRDLEALASVNGSVVISHHPEQPGVPVLTIAGRSAQLTQTSDRVRSVFQTVIDRAGARTLAAAGTTSKSDFKGMYHAFRILMEARELLNTGELRFPLSGAPLLREVRSGEYSIDRCVGMCEEAVAEVREAEKVTELPELVDPELIRGLTINIHEMILGISPRHSQNQKGPSHYVP